jgi:Tfp pilus assembly protein PilF
MYSAIVNDKGKGSFEVSVNCFFHYGIVSHPNNKVSLLNWALIQQCYKNDYHQAERFYRKALHADPSNIKVLVNYVDFLRERIDPKGVYHDGTMPMDAANLDKLTKMVKEMVKKDKKLSEKV